MSRHGVPETVVSDNGPQYSSKEFQQFCKEWEFQHITSSPHYHQSNGQSESAVKTIKGLLKKSIDSGQDFYKCLLAYRSTPLKDSLSPSQLLMGRNLRTFLPIHPSLMNIEPSPDHPEKILANRIKQKHYYDRNTTPLSPINSGQRVTIRNPINSLWSENRTVHKQTATRSYEVQTDTGSRIRRNRSDLRIIRSDDQNVNNSDSNAQSEGIVL